MQVTTDQIERACCAAATEYGVRPALLLAICDRESNRGAAIGMDSWGLHADGHGHGLFGIDDRSHAEFCIHPANQASALAQARYACGILRSDMAWCQRMPSIPSGWVESIALAGYNCGVGFAYKAWLRTGDPDKATTGGDYSSSVLCRAAELEAKP